VGWEFWEIGFILILLAYSEQILKFSFPPIFEPNHLFYTHYGELTKLIIGVTQIPLVRVKRHSFWQGF